MALTNPPTSPVTPPPNAIRRADRSAPALVISVVSRSTWLIRLWRSPGGRKSTIGSRGESEACMRGPHRAQISGEVKRKMRLRPASAGMRFDKESRMPLPTETVYGPNLVVTEILRTAWSIVSQSSGLAGVGDGREQRSGCRCEHHQDDESERESDRHAHHFRQQHL